MKKTVCSRVMMLLLAGTILTACTSGASSGGSTQSAGQNISSPDTSASGQTGTNWALQNTVRKLDVDDIFRIDFSLAAEGGILDGSTQNADYIEEIYNAICDLQLGAPTTKGVEDDGMFLKLFAGEKEYSFYFESNITDTANGRFEVENFSPLKGIVSRLIEEGEDWGRGDSAPADAGWGRGDSAPADAASGTSAGTGKTNTQRASSGITSAVADKDVTIRPTEAQSVKLVTYKQPQGEFTMKVPEGWMVQNAGDYVGYSIRAYDPDHPMRQVFIQLCGIGYQDKSVASMAQNYMMFGETSYYMPEATTKGWWDGYFATNGGSFTVHENLGKTPIGGDILFATAFDANGDNSEGIFTGVVYSVDIYTGMNFSVTLGEAMQAITADPYEFTEWEPVLLECMASITFSDAFWQNRALNWQQIMSTSSYISQTWNNISDNVMDSYARRTSSQDIMMQEWSDAELGYERIYDTQTGETYKASNGFMDHYTGSRYQKVEAGSDLYNRAVSGYIELR